MRDVIGIVIFFIALLTWLIVYYSSVLLSILYFLLDVLIAIAIIALSIIILICVYQAIRYLYTQAPKFFRFLRKLGSNVWQVCSAIGQLFYAIWKNSVQFFGCKVCDHTGTLSGKKNLLNLNVHDQKCYVCHGDKLVFRNEWYKILKDTMKKIKLHNCKIIAVEEQIVQYKKDIKVSEKLDSNTIGERFNTQLEALETQLTFEQSQRDFFCELEGKIHLILHKKYLHKLQNDWQKRIEKNSENNIDTYSDSLALRDEVNLNNLFDSEVAYLDTIADRESTDDLIKDINKATEKLKKEFVVQ